MSAFYFHPLILAVQGPPGDGKSYQTLKSLEESRFTVFRLSSSLLSGGLEGAPIERVKDLYQRAADYHAARPTALPALILEDFDMSSANQRGDARYTVNSQLLAGYLMNLADDVETAGVNTTHRYPIFLTGNDFASLHGPLIRPGRVDFFTWQPDQDERAQVVQSLLSQYAILTPAEAGDLSARYKKLPISAFRAAAQDCLARRAYDYISATQEIKLIDLRRHFDERQYPPISYQELSNALAPYEDGANRARNFLRGRNG